MNLIDKDTVLYLSCNDTNDSSPMKHKMIVSGTAEFSDDAKEGKSFDFKNSWAIRTQESDNLSMKSDDDYTIDFWINLDYKDFQYPLISNKGYHDLCFCFQYNKLYLYAGYDAYYIFEISDIKINEWFHIALVRSNNILSLYINGELIKSIQDHNDISMTSACIGYRAGDEQYKFTGKIDKIRITKKALWNNNFDPETYKEIPMFDLSKQENDNINITNSKIDIATKIEININNELSDTHTNVDLKNNNSFILNSKYFIIGNNDVEFIIYKDSKKYANRIEVNYIPEKLTNEATIEDINNRITLISKTRDHEYESIKNILINKQIEVKETDRMCDLIEKIHTLHSEDLYLFKENLNTNTNITGGWVEEDDEEE